MKAARYYGPGDIRIEEEAVPEPGDDGVLIRVKASGICGTDYHIYRGEIKGLVEPGTVLGHEFSGIVEKVGKNAGDITEGERVAVEPNLFCGKCHYCRNAKKHFCVNWKAIGLSIDGGFEEYVAVPSSAVYKLPEGLEFEAAAFFEPMACVLHGIERAGVKPGDIVIVRGAGSIGLLYIQALARAGASLIIVSDIDDTKLKLARELGADLTVNVKRESLKDAVMAETNGLGARIFIDAAGLPDTVPYALEMIENTGIILLFGVPPENTEISIRPYEIYRREISVVGSFTNPYTNEDALRVLRKIKTEPLITNPIKLEDLISRGMEVIGKPGVIKVQIRF